MDEMKKEAGTGKTFKQRAAEVVGDLLVGSINGSRGVCITFMVAEPKYPVSILKEDLDN